MSAAVWFSGHLAREGAAAYVHLIRAADDPPDAAPRGGGSRGSASCALGGIQHTSVADWTLRLQQHLGDGQARTFNRISLELAARAADVAFQSHLDRALWRLVSAEFVEHTGTAPIFFRLRRTGAPTHPPRVVPPPDSDLPLFG